MLIFMSIYDDAQEDLSKYSFQKSFTMYKILGIYKAPFSSSSLEIRDRYNIIFKFVTYYQLRTGLDLISTQEIQ